MLENLEKRHSENKRMAHVKTDTHFYDGKLQHLTASHADAIERAACVSKEQKQRVFAVLQRILDARSDATLHAKRCLSVVCDTFARYGRVATGANTNWDERNGLHADDLLYLVAKHIHQHPAQEDDVMMLLCAQLHDMRTGLCPQGRTTRFMQVLHALAYE